MKTFWIVGCLAFSAVAGGFQFVDAGPFSPDAKQELNGIVQSAVEQGFPVVFFEKKIAEGVSKGKTEDQIINALSIRFQKLIEGRAAHAGESPGKTLFQLEQAKKETPADTLRAAVLGTAPKNREKNVSIVAKEIPKPAVEKGTKGPEGGSVNEIAPLPEVEDKIARQEQKIEDKLEKSQSALEKKEKALEKKLKALERKLEAGKSKGKGP